MIKLFSLVKRNILETVRDPLSSVFCVAFPVVMLVFMQVIFSSMQFVPPNFSIENYAMGICVFGYTFTGMFVSMGIAGDKNSSFIKRVNISPIKTLTYYLSYLISAFIIAILQTVLFLILALIFKLPFDARLFLAMLYMLPSAIFYISFGILLGSICSNEKQAGPINSIIISTTGILGGIFMPISSFTGAFEVIVNLLPFSHSVLIASELYTVGASCIYPHIIYLLIYIAIIWLVIYVTQKLKSK